jgi:hypothetical protein
MSHLPRIYVSGPITGLPHNNAPAFNAAAVALREAGYELFNPVNNNVPMNAPWATHMRADIVGLMGCYGLCCLPGWFDSRGAKLEMQIAQELEITCAPLEFWLEHAKASK